MRGRTLEDVLNDAGFARNLRGRLAAALRAIDPALHPVLACDYAEHVLPLCEECLPGDGRFRTVLTALRAFLDGNCGIEAVAEARSALFDAQSELQARGPEWKPAADAAWTLTLAIDVCCQRELEQAKAVFRTRWQPRADAVAFEAARAVALRAAGDGWDADDPEVRMAARQRGRTASDTEVQWQLERLVRRVREHGS